jgi:signal transduction histidine kinase
MYQIDFNNNGNPLLDGMTKSRFGIRGEKAGLTAGSGSGGYIVKSIVNHYGGDYDIFCKDGITTVRILLPIATI